MKKNILITGAGGFVGKNLSESLDSKIYNITSLRRKDLDLLDASQVEKFFKKNYFDVVINCATVGGTRKTGYDINCTDIVKKNLQMFFNITRSIDETTHLINFGSGAEYNKRNSIVKKSEDEFDKRVPQDDYGYSKYVISKYIQKSKNITCLRIFGLYGKYEDYTFKFISNSIVKNLLNLPIVINQNVVFDYLYIDDLIKIIDKFIQKKPQNNILNVTPTKSIDLVTIIDIINEISNFKNEIIVLNEGLNKEYTGDNTKLLKNINKFEFTPYKKGITNAYKYYKNILNEIDVEAIKKDPYLKCCKVSK